MIYTTNVHVDFCTPKWRVQVVQSNKSTNMGVSNLEIVYITNANIECVFNKKGYFPALWKKGSPKFLHQRVSLHGFNPGHFTLTYFTSYFTLKISQMQESILYMDGMGNIQTLQKKKHAQLKSK